ncbi:MAG: hypothetical protein LBT53_02720 [Puniceicoccales bacterium]|jgi:hypothetical protein|nr:hypothetical protein [Puniceicoccales bacterium]
MTRRTFFPLLLLGVAAPAAVFAAPPAAVAAPEWRDMLREELRLRQSAPTPEMQKAFHDVAPEMARLGEAFAKTAYPKNLPLGRKNFLSLVRNLGMRHPNAAELRQFLHPNKKPWDGYTGPSDGNFHMLFNTGTLNLDTADGASKDHPARRLAKQHLSFWAGQSHVKALTQTLCATIRAEQADTAALCADTAKRAAFSAKFREAWAKRYSGKKLSDGDIAFAEAMLAYTA